MEVIYQDAAREETLCCDECGGPAQQVISLAVMEGDSVFDSGIRVCLPCLGKAAGKLSQIQSEQRLKSVAGGAT